MHMIMCIGHNLAFVLMLWDETLPVILESVKQRQGNDEKCIFIYIRVLVHFLTLNMRWMISAMTLIIKECTEAFSSNRQASYAKVNVALGACRREKEFIQKSFAHH